MILPWQGVLPRLAEGVFVAPGAVVAGDVEIGADSGIWFNCTIRGDVNFIRIGRRTNIQDGTVIHVSSHDGPTQIGDEVTVGHGAILHACTIHDRSLIGMGAVVLDGALVESFGWLAAGALLTPGKRIPSGELWAGTPARKVRDLSQADREAIIASAVHYVELARGYSTSP